MALYRIIYSIFCCVFIMHASQALPLKTTFKLSRSPSSTHIYDVNLRNSLASKNITKIIQTYCEDISDSKFLLITKSIS